MRILGVSEGYHDAAACLIEDGEILYAEHSERISRKKNDKWLTDSQLRIPRDKTIYYEKPFRKNLRRFFKSGQKTQWPRKELKIDKKYSHHWSHAAAGYYTRPFPEEPVCVVIDAIGEWDTASIWYKGKKVWSRIYPWSLGLFYSAVTKHLGYTPNQDEYIVMALAAGGNRFKVGSMDNLLDYNLHRGFEGIEEVKDQLNFRWPIIPMEKEDIAASAQHTLENEIKEIMVRASQYSSYLVYGGGVALNCVANTNVVAKIFDPTKIWIFPSPGDAGSALGAAAAYYGKPLNMKGIYLGHDIQTKINPRDVTQHLSKYGVVGIANGRSEFGPRALGNRSLLADPRRDIKDTLDRIKKREGFRPFAPAILGEYFDEYFKGPKNEYMQYVSKIKYPRDEFKGTHHIDNTSRVQVVRKDSRSILRPILEEWYDKTGCPMLINTSLNVKGEPMVNNRSDAKLAEFRMGVKVF